MGRKPTRIRGEDEPRILSFQIAADLDRAIDAERERLAQELGARPSKTMTVTSLIRAGLDARRDRRGLTAGFVPVRELVVDDDRARRRALPPKDEK